MAVSHLLESLVASFGASTAAASCFSLGLELKSWCSSGGGDGEDLSSSSDFSK